MNTPETIRLLRKARGMTQTQLAQKAHISRTTLFNIEKGKRSPSDSIMASLAEAFGLTVLELTVACLEETDITPKRRLLYRYIVEPIRQEILGHGKVDAE